MALEGQLDLLIKVEDLWEVELLVRLIRDSNVLLRENSVCVLRFLLRPDGLEGLCQERVRIVQGNDGGSALGSGQETLCRALLHR